MRPLALNPLMIFVFTPMLVRLWAAQARRNVESFRPPRWALGCAFVALASMLMSVGAWLSAGDKASAWWLVGYILAGWLGGFWSTTEKARFFLMIAAVAALAGAALWVMSAVLRSAFVAHRSGDQGVHS